MDTFVKRYPYCVSSVNNYIFHEITLNGKNTWLFLWYNLPMSSQEQLTYFGTTDFRNRKTKFGIKNVDRSRHVYIIGKTGMGKSTLLENMAAQDILNGEGMCFVDPHGSAIDTLLEYIPEHRINDVVYFAPFDTNYPISFNVMEDVDPDSRHLVVNGLMASFKKIWQDAWSARMEYILTNTLLALLEYPNSTLLGVNRMLAEKDYRDEVVKHITDSSVKSFWIDEYGKWDQRYAREAGAAIQNKIGQFTANPLIRNIIGQSESSFDIREIMDKQKIFLVNLSKGRIGEQNAKLLGGMIITKIYLAAMSRAEVGGSGLNGLPNFYFFVDEFQNFATESFADILSEARKYKLNLTIAHQYVAQMQEEVRDAVVGNVGTMITFRIGAEDAELFEKQFSPVFTVEDIVNLGKFQVYLSLMIDGIGSKPFSAQTLPPIEKPSILLVREVIEASRSKYAEERSLVEQKIAQWYEPVKKPQKRTIKDLQSQSASKSKHSSEKKDSSKKSKESGKTFVVNSDTETPHKKEQKEHNENEDIRAHVSPKLHNLLNNFEQDKKEGKHADKKAFSKKNEERSKKPASSSGHNETQNKSRNQETIEHTQTNNNQSKQDRRAKGETKNALQLALEKAMGEQNKTQKKQEPSQQSTEQKHNQGSTNAQSSQHQGKDKEEGTKPSRANNHNPTLQKQENHQESSDQTSNPSERHDQNHKEIPEDVLRGILS